MRKKSILIPTSLLGVRKKFKHTRSGEKYSPLLGSVIFHISFLKEKGAVFWIIPTARPGCIPIEKLRDVSEGYFYIGNPVGSVKYAIDIEYVKTTSEIPEDDLKYMPRIRKRQQYDDDQDENYYLDEFIWLKIIDIKRIEKDLTFTDFTSYKSGKPLERLQHPTLVNYIELPTRKIESNFKESHGESIQDAVKGIRWTEKNIEDILELSLNHKDPIIYGRQSSTRDGRLDIIFQETEKDPLYVVELKKDADLNTILQIKDYMEDIKKEYHPKKMQGIILCHTFTSELEKSLINEPDIELRTYSFDVNFDLPFFIMATTR